MRKKRLLLKNPSPIIDRFSLIMTNLVAVVNSSHMAAVVSMLDEAGAS
jgi:hypothetical protein